MLSSPLTAPLSLSLSLSFYLFLSFFCSFVAVQCNHFFTLDRDFTVLGNTLGYHEFSVETFKENVFFSLNSSCPAAGCCNLIAITSNEPNCEELTTERPRESERERERERERKRERQKERERKRKREREICSHLNLRLPSSQLPSSKSSTVKVPLVQNYWPTDYNADETGVRPVIIPPLN
jgi:hypothetical protein